MKRIRNWFAARRAERRRAALDRELEQHRPADAGWSQSALNAEIGRTVKRLHERARRRLEQQEKDAGE